MNFDSGGDKIGGFIERCTEENSFLRAGKLKDLETRAHERRARRESISSRWIERPSIKSSTISEGRSSPSNMLVVEARDKKKKK